MSRRFLPLAACAFLVAGPAEAREQPTTYVQIDPYENGVEGLEKADLDGDGDLDLVTAVSWATRCASGSTTGPATSRGTTSGASAAATQST